MDRDKRRLKLIEYYVNLLDEKIDLHADGFVKRIETLKKSDFEQVELIEKTMLEPLEIQIKFFAQKLINLLSEKRKEKEK